jgi:hypothetical protein
LHLTQQGRFSELEDPLKDEKIRETVEKDLEPIDVAQLIFNGQVEQEVTLFGTHKLVLRSLKGNTFLLIDRWVSQTLGKRIQTPVLLTRIKYIVTAALSIASWAGSVPGNLSFYETNLDPLASDISGFAHVCETRLNWLLDMDPNIAELLALNVTWFEQRKRRVVSSASYIAQEAKKS